MAVEGRLLAVESFPVGSLVKCATSSTSSVDAPCWQAFEVSRAGACRELSSGKMIRWKMFRCKCQRLRHSNRGGLCCREGLARYRYLTDGEHDGRLLFEGRDVPPYGEYADPEALVEGACVFQGSLARRRVDCSEAEPFVFIGRNVVDTQPRVRFAPSLRVLAVPSSRQVPIEGILRAR